VILGFIIEGSTGARALAILEGMPKGALIDTIAFAAKLGVRAAALHQLLSNPVKLRLIKKVRRRGVPMIDWGLGAGNVGVTIEPRPVPRPPPTPEEIERRRLAAERRRLRAASAPPGPALTISSDWPPGFVSTFGSASDARAQAELDRQSVAQVVPDSPELLPTWLTGVAPTARGTRHRPSRYAAACPATYLARWLVHYTGEGRSLHTVIRVQSINARGALLKVWCEQQQEMRNFKKSGILRAEDADRGTLVDLDAWWRKARKRDDAIVRRSKPRSNPVPRSNAKSTPALEVGPTSKVNPRPAAKLNPVPRSKLSPEVLCARALARNQARKLERLRPLMLAFGMTLRPIGLANGAALDAVRHDGAGRISLLDIWRMRSGVDSL
jgi:hypothetical protein